MKLLSKIATLCVVASAFVLIIAAPVKAANGMPTQVEMLQKQMERQIAENAKAKEYFKLQEAKAKAEKRRISDIEMVKRQALEGMVSGNNQLLSMGDAAMSVANVDPNGAGNIAVMDQAAYEGMVSGLALLEDIKQKAWMQYTFRTH